MLFILKSDLLPQCTNSTGPEIDGLQNLLLSIRQGLHAVSGPFEVFAALAANTSLSSRERATAKNLANRRTELPTLEKLIKHKVFISNSTYALPKRIDDYSWEVGLRSLKATWLTTTNLLAENMTDAELYKIAGHHYQIQKKFLNFTFRCTTKGGGGSQTDVEFRQLLSQGTPVFAITDGDLKYPEAENSPVSKRCISALENHEGLGWHLALRAMEIENIIPHEILFEAADPMIRSLAHEYIKDLFSAGQEINKNQEINRNPCNFTCLKSGKKLHDVFKIEDENEKTYWLIIINQLQKKLKFSKECFKNKKCSSTPCNCIVNHGFGDGVLQQVKNLITTKSSHEALKSFSKNPLWMNVGEKVFETCIAFKAEKI